MKKYITLLILIIALNNTITCALGSQPWNGRYFIAKCDYKDDLTSAEFNLKDFKEIPDEFNISEYDFAFSEHVLTKPFKLAEISNIRIVLTKPFKSSFSVAFRSSTNEIHRAFHFSDGINDSIINLNIAEIAKWTASIYNRSDLSITSEYIGIRIEFGRAGQSFTPYVNAIFGGKTKNMIVKNISLTPKEYNIINSNLVLELISKAQLNEFENFMNLRVRYEKGIGAAVRTNGESLVLKTIDSIQGYSFTKLIYWAKSHDVSTINDIVEFKVDNSLKRKAAILILSDSIGISRGEIYKYWNKQRRYSIPYEMDNFVKRIIQGDLSLQIAIEMQDTIYLNHDHFIIGRLLTDQFIEIYPDYTNSNSILLETLVERLLDCIELLNNKDSYVYLFKKFSGNINKQSVDNTSKYGNGYDIIKMILKSNNPISIEYFESVLKTEPDINLRSAALYSMYILLTSDFITEPTGKERIRLLIKDATKDKNKRIREESILLLEEYKKNIIEES